MKDKFVRFILKLFFGLYDKSEDVLDRNLERQIDHKGTVYRFLVLVFALILFGFILGKLA